MNLKKSPADMKDDIQEQWESVMQIANASTEQLELYRTQILVKLDTNIRMLVKILRTVKNLLIALLIFVVIIALLV